MIRAALLGLVTALVAALLLARPLLASEPAVTLADVQAMQARIPDCERCTRVSGAFARTRDARAIAAAIAQVAPTREAAAELALYAAWESGNRIDVVGDGGLALGPWQLHDARATALEPVRAARRWLQLAAASREKCAGNAPEERLAALASGSCDRGRAIVRRRDEVAMLLAQGRSP